jgi:hypothetical protein
MKLYIETTVPNFLFAGDAPEKKSATEEFFKWLKICRDELFTSALVLEELEAAPQPLRAKLLRAINSVPCEVLERINQINLRYGLPPVKIHTPEEMLDYEIQRTPNPAGRAED